MENGPFQRNAGIVSVFPTIAMFLHCLWVVAVSEANAVVAGKQISLEHFGFVSNNAPAAGSLALVMPAFVMTAAMLLAFVPSFTLNLATLWHQGNRSRGPLLIGFFWMVLLYVAYQLITKNLGIFFRYPTTGNAFKALCEYGYTADIEGFITKTKVFLTFNSGLFTIACGSLCMNDDSDDELENLSWCQRRLTICMYTIAAFMVVALIQIRTFAQIPLAGIADESLLSKYKQLVNVVVSVESLKLSTLLLAMYLAAHWLIARRATQCAYNALPVTHHDKVGEWLARSGLETNPKERLLPILAILAPAISQNIFSFSHLFG